jgi:DNA-binding IclR family transcriptional regulator
LYHRGFFTELEAVRTHGYAVDNGENEKICCIGVLFWTKRRMKQRSCHWAIIDLPDEE